VNFEVVNADVVGWASRYTGAKFHAMFCDPPYEYGFMGKSWDDTGIAFQSDTWQAITQHLYPGGFVMAFGGSRTVHRLMCAMEDTGLVIHPIIGWLNGQGFPKATRIDTQVDKAAGAEREVVGKWKPRGTARPAKGKKGHHAKETTAAMGAIEYEENAEIEITKPATSLAQAWEGHRYGLQALKPCLEPIVVAQKPYEGKPVECITETGAGALWIEGGRVSTNDTVGANGYWGFTPETGWNDNNVPSRKVSDFEHNRGRWPPNLALAHHPDCVRVGTKRVSGDKRGNCSGKREGGFANVGADKGSSEPNARVYGDESAPDYQCVEGCPVKALEEQSGDRTSGGYPAEGLQRVWNGIYGRPNKTGPANIGKSIGTAARFYPNFDYALEKLEEAESFFYSPKAGRKERDAGLDSRNPHPTCKPIALNQWLATLLLPPSDYAPRRLLVPFAGVASEMIGALLAGWDSITGIETDPSYCAIGKARLVWWEQQSACTMFNDVKQILKLARVNGKARASR